MLISEKMSAALNKQVNNELHASYLYLGMAMAFHDMGLKVFAGRFHQQSEEERGHAGKIMKYIQDVGASVKLESIEKPKCDCGSAASIIRAALEAEMTVTKQINDLVALAEAEKDYASRSFLQWFVDEQVEEVSSMQELLQWVEMAGEKNLFVLENRIAATMK